MRKTRRLGDAARAYRIYSAFVTDERRSDAHGNVLREAEVAREGKAEEVREILLTNPAISGEEPGRVVFALHRSVGDPNEFRIHETWESEELVSAHESSAPFLEYREKLRPLVDGDGVVWGNTAPVADKGYEA